VIRIWSLEKWESVSILEGHTAVVRSLAFSNQVIVSCSQDLSVKVWSLKTAQLVSSLEGHTADVRSVGVSADGTCAVSCSFDLTVRAWDLKTSQQTRSFTGHRDKIFGVSMSADGHMAVSCSWDMTLRVWDLQSGEQRVLEPPSGDDQRLVRSAPESLLGGRRAIVDAVQNALKEKMGYDVQSDEGDRSDGSSSSNESVMGKKKRIVVHVDEVERVDVQGKDASEGDSDTDEEEDNGGGIKGLLKSALSNLINSGNKQDGGNYHIPEITGADLDEEHWARMVAAQEGMWPSEMERGEDARMLYEEEECDGEDDEDEAEEKQRYLVNALGRQRAAMAFLLGFVLFFPWVMAFFIRGGIKSADRFTR